MCPCNTDIKYCVATRCPASSKKVGTNFSGQALKKASISMTCTCTPLRSDLNDQTTTRKQIYELDGN
eukprot:m.354801 g.354801  ORF g.354801 m.354801 type:complete len:67 (-) comp20725_c0_seq2:422-622(-)